MKRKLIWVVIAVLIIGAAVAAVLLFSGDKEQNMEAPTNDAGFTHMQLLKLDEFSELEEYVQNNDLILQTSDDTGLTSVGGVPISEHYMTLYFQNDDAGVFYRVDGFVDLFLEKRDVGELKSVLDGFCDAVAQLFDIDKAFRYTIYASDGYEIESASDESLQKILDGTAYFALSVIDADRSYWYAEATVDGADRVMFSFWHSVDPEEALLEFEANIVLASPAGAED